MEKIKLLNPVGRNGLKIKINDYVLLRSFILQKLMNTDSMTIISIIDSVEEELLPFTNLDGDFKLMTLAVKQDLEARGYIKKMRAVYGLVQRYQIKTSKKYLYKLLSLEPAIS